MRRVRPPEAVAHGLDNHKPIYPVALLRGIFEYAIQYIEL